MPLTDGADRMAVTDPHGWTLTLVSVIVVFAALIVLYFIYTFSGNAFSGKFRRSAPARAKKGRAPEGEVAVAIALALRAAAGGGETEAAIAAALHLHLSSDVHDVEPGIITIRREGRRAWDDKSFNFRKLPR